MQQPKLIDIEKRMKEWWELCASRFPNMPCQTWEQFFRNAPAVDAEPVRHGRWATDEEDIRWGTSLKRKHCTNCGKRPHFDKEKREFVLTNYCPHCGAKMDGGKEE